MEIKEKVIGGNTYYVRALPPLESLKLLGDLQAVVTGSMGDSIEGEGPALERDVNLGTIIAGIGSKLTGEKLVGFAERLLKEDYVSVRMDGKSEPVKLNMLKREEIFTGKIKDMLAVMIFVLEVNYSDFFDLIPKSFGNIMAQAQK